MNQRPPNRLSDRSTTAPCALLFALAMLLAAAGAPAQTRPAQPDPTQSAAPVVLDQAIAVVNRHLILASDLDDEMRLSILEPTQAGQGPLSRRQALDELISRALIEQQIRQEDAEAAGPKQAQVDARLAQIRKQLPACVRLNCASEAGWSAFLARYGLTLGRVEAYLRYRLEILRFIEQRFRPGIRISQPEIAAYYRNTLLPQYPAGDPVPSLDDVAPRIEEILLEQQVNVLFDQWLTNLRKQGDVEILDPALETPETQTAAQTQSAAPGAKP